MIIFLGGLIASQNEEDSSSSLSWLLLDLNFGLPLFDSGLNKRICSGIIEKGLCGKERSVLALMKTVSSKASNSVEAIKPLRLL